MRDDAVFNLYMQIGFLVKMKNEVKVAARTEDVLSDLHNSVRCKTDHAKDMMDAAIQRGNTYPDFKLKEERIAQHWMNEMAAYQKVSNLLDAALDRFRSAHELGLFDVSVVNSESEEM